MLPLRLQTTKAHRSAHTSMQSDQHLCFSACRWSLKQYIRLIISILILSFVKRLNNECFLAHLSLRLIGELIGYSWSSVCQSSIRPQCSKIFSKTAWPIKAKFYVEPPWVGGTKVCSRHLGHMTKMAMVAIFGKNPSKIFFSRTGGPIFTKLGM